MKVDAANGLRAPPGARRAERGGAKSAEFARHMSQTAGASPLGGPSAVGMVDGLLSLQEVDDPAGRSARAGAQGRAMLDRLDELRLAILGEAPRASALTELAELARAPRESGIDPGLAEVLDAIHLRAEVELAKLSQEK